MKGVYDEMQRHYKSQPHQIITEERARLIDKVSQEVYDEVLAENGVKQEDCASCGRPLPIPEELWEHLSQEMRTRVALRLSRTGEV